jgi:hypothetical protein
MCALYNLFPPRNHRCVREVNLGDLGDNHRELNLFRAEAARLPEAQREFVKTGGICGGVVGLAA